MAGRIVRARAAVAAAALLLSLGLLSCSRPAVQEGYVRSSSRDALGRYAFSVELADSLSYGMDLYLLMDCSDRTFRKFSGCPLKLDWLSPSEESFSESGQVSPAMLSHRTFFSKTLLVPYRASSRPSESGIWKLFVTLPPETVRDFGLSGVGLEIKQDGTR